LLQSPKIYAKYFLYFYFCIFLRKMLKHANYFWPFFLMEILRKRVMIKTFANVKIIFLSLFFKKLGHVICFIKRTSLNTLFFIFLFFTFLPFFKKRYHDRVKYTWKCNDDIPTKRNKANQTEFKNPTHKPNFF